MAKAATGIPAARLAVYERLVAANPDVSRKGATMPYTSRNGHMFSFLTRTGSLVLRLSEADREAFMKKYGTTLHTAHGRVMQEFVEVPDPLLTKLEELQPYFARSHDYVGSLRPKATTRAPAAKQPAAKQPTAKKLAAKQPAAKKSAARTVARSKPARKR